MNSYDSMISQIRTYARNNDFCRINRAIQTLSENFADKLEANAENLFNSFFDSKEHVVCFALFSNEFTRRFFYDEKRMPTNEQGMFSHEIRIKEHEDSMSYVPTFIPQWNKGQDKSFNIKIDMLNKLILISMDKAYSKKLLGVQLKQSHVESGREKYEVEKSSSKFMLLPIGNYDYNHATPNAPLLPLFNGETHSEIIVSDNLPDNEAHNEYSGNLAYYGMPILNGLKVINNGSSAVNIYYIPVYEKRG